MLPARAVVLNSENQGVSRSFADGDDDAGTRIDLIFADVGAARWTCHTTMSSFP